MSSISIVLFKDGSYGVRKHLNHCPQFQHSIPQYKYVAVWENYGHQFAFDQNERVVHGTLEQAQKRFDAVCKLDEVSKPQPVQPDYGTPVTVTQDPRKEDINDPKWKFLTIDDSKQKICVWMVEPTWNENVKWYCEPKDTTDRNWKQVAVKKGWQSVVDVGCSPLTAKLRESIQFV